MHAFQENARFLIFKKSVTSRAQDVSSIPFLIREVATFDGTTSWELPHGALTQDTPTASFTAALTDLPSFQLKPDDVISLGKRALPNWDKPAPPALDFFVLLLNEEQLGTFPVQLQLHWHSAAEVLVRFDASELLLSPLTLQTIRNLASSSSLENLIAHNQAQCQQGSRSEAQTKLELAPNIEFIPLPSNTLFPFSHTNLVVIHSQGEYLLVDPGSSPEAAPHLQAVLTKLKAKSLKVLITHHHKDHWESLSIVAQHFPQAVVIGHVLTLERISTSLATQPLNGSSEIKHGDLILHAVHSPGHTDGHIAVWEPTSRTLIPGDHVVGIGSAVLDAANGGDVGEYIATTKMFIDLNPRIVLPAHGPPSFSPIRLLQTYIKHRQDREDAILACYLSGKTTLEEIVQVVYKDVSPNLWKAAQTNIFLHLRKLANEGKIPRINL